MPKLPVGLLVFAFPALLPAQEPPWRAPGVQTLERAGEVVWRAVATETARDVNAARQAAERAARSMLANSAKSRIQTDLEQVVREREHGGKAESETEVRSVLRQTTDVELRRAIPVRVEHKLKRDGVLGYAEVEVTEGDLIPTTRLRAAIRKEGTAALLQLADLLEADQLWALAEQALQVARDRDGGPALLLRLGQHHEKREDFGEAVRWYTAVVATGDAAGSDEKAIARARDCLATIRARVPSVAAQVVDLRQLAEARRQPQRLLVSARYEAGTVRVTIKLTESHRRILSTWVDDTITLHYVATDNPILTSSDLPLPWPPDTDRPKNPARLILWSLAVDDPLWADLELVADRAWPLTGDVDVLERDRLHGLIAKLRASDAPTWVVAMDR